MQIGNGGLSGDCSLKREETDARRHTKALLGGVAALAAMVLASGQAHATLALTADGVADGFTLTTFVSGYNFGSIYGPLGQGILPNSNVVTGSLGDDRIYVFKDVDNQTLANAVSATPYSFLTGVPFYATTTAGGLAYGAQILGSAPYEHFNTDGSHSPIPGLTATNMQGVSGNPVNGHIIASANQGLIDIDPVAGTFRVIVTPNPDWDGVSVSPDGRIAYAANVPAGTIQAYDIISGALLHTYRPQGSGDISNPGVISNPGGKFDGFIIANNHDGTVGLIDPTLGTEDIIASGGSRGDWISPDTSNGTLFLSQLERVDRLAPPPPVPEPASLAVLGTALLAFAGFRRRKRQLALVGSG